MSPPTKRPDNSKFKWKMLAALQSLQTFCFSINKHRGKVYLKI